jgi:branched-chain amino acid transport system substrate-binding protein
MNKLGYARCMLTAGFVFLAAATLPFGCDRGTASPTTPTGGGPTSALSGSPAERGAAGTNPILIGHFASMTGSEATWGVSTDAGVRMAVDEENKNGGVNGRPLKVITYDNQGRQQESATAVTRLITQDKVAAVLGEVASSRSIAGGQVAQRFGIPMISPSSTNPRVTDIGDMIFRVCYIDPFQGYVCAKFARGEPLKATKAATLFNRSQIYSTGLNDTFKQHFAEMGGKITTEQAYGDGDTDFSAQLTNIRETQPDVIFIPGYYTEVVNIAVQARRLGLMTPFLGGDGWDAEDLKNAGTALDGSFFCNHYSHEEQRPEVQDFVKKYQQDGGRIPDGMAATGYDSAKILIDAMRRAKSLGGKDLAKAIAETKDFHAVTGIISMDAHRNAVKPAVILRMQGGKPSYVCTIAPP